MASTLSLKSGTLVEMELLLVKGLDFDGFISCAQCHYIEKSCEIIAAIYFTRITFDLC